MDFVLLGKTFRYILAKRFEDGMLSEEQLRHNRIDEKIGGRFFFIYGVFVTKKNERKYIFVFHIMDKFTKFT